MRRKPYLVLVLLFAVLDAAAETPAYPHRTSLDGTWNFQPLARTVLKGDGSIVDNAANLPAPGTMAIPSNWHLNGLQNFNGRVRFSRDFDFSEKVGPLDRVFVIFHGVDYFADVELNGAPVGRHEGYFQPFEFDVTPQLRRGRNSLAVNVDAPMEEPGAVWPDHKRLIKGVLSHWDCKPGSVSKEFGQDGTSAGIWNSVEMEIRHAAWLGNVKIQPVLYERRLRTGKSEETGFDTKVFITAEVRAARPGRYVLEAEAGGAKVSSEVQLTSGDSMVVLVLPMERPRLWWTWDLGEPNLYTCKLTLAEAGATLYSRDVKFGVRRIELDEKTGEWRLNGVRFFIRGTNVTPDMWLAHYTPDLIAQDVKLLKEAYVNGVRVCVHVNREEFYDALDRAGILAWQDFPLQWDYTHTDDFMQEAARQLRDMIRQFYNHPSIVTWVCQNESTAYNVNVLDPFLARVGAQEDSSRPVRPVSAFSEHLYEGWYSGDYRNYLKLPGGPTISEFGAQAFPSLEETGELVGDTWPPDWRKLAYYDFQYDQTFHVAKIPLGSSWKEFVENSQRYQADLLKFALEHYRRAKYTKTGSLFQFQFVDCWPAITWSVVSYARRPKLGYFAMQRAYKPVLIGAELDRTVWSKGRNVGEGAPGVGVRIWVVNDKQQPLEGLAYEARLRGQGKDLRVGGSKTSVTVAADSVANLPGLWCVPPEELPRGEYELVLTLKQGDQSLSENSYSITVVE